MLQHRPQRPGLRGRALLTGALALVSAATIAAPTALADGPATMNRLEIELDGLADRVIPSVVAIQRNGAGIVISADGLVLTSTSVVPRAGRTVNLTLVGGRRVQAKEVARDTANGAVILRIRDAETLGLTPAVLGFKQSIAPGTMVATFGNPYGTHATDGRPAMSLGVVSGLYPMPGDKRGGLAIETDAAVNPGSFGGPLVNRQGQLVGVVVPAYRNDRFLGLARPIDSLEGLVAAAKAGVPYVVAKAPTPKAVPSAERGLLGIFIFKDDASPTGARVEKVQAKSAAGEAGIRSGDIVRRFNGKTVDSSKELAGFLMKVKPNDKVKLRVERNKWFRDFTLTARGTAVTAGRPYLGVYLSTSTGGLTIDRVEDGGPAAKAGLKAGDILADFADMTKLQAYMKDKKPGQKIDVRVIREGWSKTVSLTIGARPDGPQAQAPTPSPRTEPRPTPTPRTQPKEKGYLGVYLEEADGGIGVTDVVDGSPAAKAGFKTGDVIVRVQGKRTQTLDAFGAAMAGAGAGDTLEVRVRRESGRKNLSVTLSKRPGSVPAPRAEAPAPAPKKRGYLGVYLAEGDGQVGVGQVIPGSPAAKAGLLDGDIITKVGGKRVDSVASLSSVMSGYGVGDKVSIEVERVGGVKITQVILGDRPEAAPAPRAEAPAPAPKKKGFLGVYLEEGGYGVKVSDLVPGSPAAKGGLRADDVIVEVGGRGTANLDAFTAAMGRYGAGDKVAFSIARGGEARTLQVTLGERPTQVPAPRVEAPAPPKKKGFLGISVTEEDNGLVISEIVDGSPAAKSALALGHKIVSVNDTPVQTIEDLGGVLSKQFAGDTIHIEVEGKGGARRVIDVTLAPRS